ncbi:MAG: hypothetical protein GWP61_11255 [Chloroflexi bacterium]|jgi:4-amino-4-deoxy-L-arabinose transferase-like glycosyltransferase|nr:hypothetical protein [Chloroflexota bacterium]
MMIMATQNRKRYRKGVLFSPVWWVVIILLMAAALRVIGVVSISPPGLEHDEVANWLIDQAILEGNHAIYFAEAYGHEAGFHYLQAISVALVGDNALALRLPAIYAGIMLVAVHFALIRRLLDVKLALLSTALLAVLFWPVFYSRLGLRAILLPLVSGISLYCWWKAWGLRNAKAVGKRSLNFARITQASLFWFGLAGVFAGLTLYTYMAARAVPIFFGVFVLYLALFHWSRVKGNWRGIFLFWAFLIVVAAPLAIYLRVNPGAEFRVSEIDAPLRAFLAGNLRPVVENSLKILGMFGFRGDPLWRQNVAGRPVFGPLLALLFYPGLLLALWRARDERYAFLLLWLGAAAIPSIVTVDAPSSIRMINALLVVTVFPALIIHIIPRLSTVRPRLSTVAAYLLALLVILTHIWWTGAGIFHTWPQNDEVRFVWQSALTRTAVFLDRSPDNGPVAVGGWSPGTLDPATLLLSMERRDLDMRHFGSDSTASPVSTLIIPHHGADSNPRITRPAIRELAPGLEAQLAAWGAAPQRMGDFVLYELPGAAQVEPQYGMKTVFEDELQFLGISPMDSLENCVFEGCWLLSYWRVLAATNEPRRFFLHAVNNAGGIVAQHDGLDAPAMQWQVGDVLVQAHFLELETAESIQLRLGVYDPQTGRRLIAADHGDFIPLLFP